ncbi:hypothetical protein G9A89_017019 [Geosiphon pyriformis]|nr:hypothetical protein G9A89_017019 [Geosiphon pyriformis]
MVLGLYTGVSFEMRFSQALEVNSVIVEAVNSSTFVVLSRNFNENGSGRSVTFSLLCVWFFNTDYNAVLVLIGLGRLLDVRLNSLYKQTNKDHWKFKIKDTNGSKWTGFRNCLSTKLLMVAKRFSGAETNSDVDAMKQTVPLVVPDLWTHQYVSLNYIQDCAFSGVMSAVSLSELLLVVNDLPNDKAAGLSDIPNEL